MKRPPSASSGAQAIACSAPSSAPQRSSSSAATAARSAGLLTSSPSTSGGRGRPAAAVADPRPAGEGAVPLVGRRALHDLALDVDGAAQPPGVLDPGVSPPPQRHHLLGIERDEAGGVGEHEQPVGDPLPEDARG